MSLPHSLRRQLREGRPDGLVEAAEAEVGGEVGVDGVVGAQEVELWKRFQNGSSNTND